MNQATAVRELQRLQEFVHVIPNIHDVETWVQASKVNIVHEFEHHADVCILALLVSVVSHGYPVSEFNLVALHGVNEFDNVWSSA